MELILYAKIATILGKFYLFFIIVLVYLATEALLMTALIVILTITEH